jgi:hypothetical protein
MRETMNEIRIGTMSKSVCTSAIEVDLESGAKPGAKKE